MNDLFSRILGHEKNKQRFLKVLEEQRMPSTHIFVGPEGVGKRTLALAIAQYLICENQQGCGECGPCLRVKNQQSENLLIVEPDGQSIKISQSQGVIKYLSLELLGRARVVIIDGIQKMNPQASNALLKTFEEPQENTYFFLITNSLLGLLPTIRSRSLVTHFGFLTTNQVEQVLIQNQEEYTTEQVTHSQGSVDKAMKLRADILDQVKSFHEGLWLDFFRSKNTEVALFDVLKAYEKEIKDKELCYELSQFLQKNIQWVWKSKTDNFTEDSSYKTRADEQLRILSYTQLDSLFLGSVQLEKDFKSNVDASLSLGQFFMNASEVINEQH